MGSRFSATVKASNGVTACGLTSAEDHGVTTAHSGRADPPACSEAERGGGPCEAWWRGLPHLAIFERDGLPMTPDVEAATAPSPRFAGEGDPASAIEIYDWPPWTTVTARRFCDQQEMSLQTATGRSLP